MFLGGFCMSASAFAVGGSAVALEENRQKIVGVQWELAHALIALHAPAR